MTAQPGTAPAGAPPSADAPPPRIVPQPGTPLHELLGQREAALAQLADAKARADALTKAIKNMVSQASPGIPVIDIAGDSTIAPLRMAWRTPRRLDTDRFRAEQRPLYDYYLIWGTPYWELRPVSG